MSRSVHFRQQIHVRLQRIGEHHLRHVVAAQPRAHLLRGRVVDRHVEVRQPDERARDRLARRQRHRGLHRVGLRVQWRDRARPAAARPPRGSSMRPCSAAGSYFAPTPFRSPVGEVAGAAAARAVEVGCARLGIADHDVEDLVVARDSRPRQIVACRNVARSDDLLRRAGRTSACSSRAGRPSGTRRAACRPRPPARAATASGPIRPPRRARWSRGRSRTWRPGSRCPRSTAAGSNSEPSGLVGRAGVGARAAPAGSRRAGGGPADAGPAGSRPPEGRSPHTSRTSDASHLQGTSLSCHRIT